MSHTSVSAPPLSRPATVSPVAHAIGQMRLWGDAMWGIIRRDAILLVSYRSQLVAQFLGPPYSITLLFFLIK